MLAAATLVALMLATGPAQAHEVFGIGGVAGGLLHPLLVPSHAMTLVALSLLIAQQAQRRDALVALFAAGMIAGLIVIVSAFALDRTNEAVLAVAAVAGLAVALEHDTEKWIPVFGKRSCSNKELERDDDSKKSHRL